jgi:phytoene dehydrogenase-like protein
VADYFTSSVDIVVIGAGQNGLIAADYLKRAGFSVMVVERRLESGGGLTGEEPTLNGFWHTTGNPFQDASTILPFTTDLGLAQYNGRWITPEVQSSLPLPDGRWLVVYADLERTLRSIAAISPRDATQWRSIVELFRTDAKAIRAHLTSPAGDPAHERYEATGYGRLAASARGKTPMEVIDGYFESDAVKALVLMHLAAPRGIGCDYENAGPIVPLAIGLAGENRLAAGGVHELAQALWSACIRGDGDVWDSTCATRILIENGRAVGVEVTGGRRIAARAVISSVDLETTFLKLLDPEHVPAALARRVRDFEADEYSLFAVHLALREPPRFADAQAGRAFRVNLGVDSPAAARALWQEIRSGALPQQPGMTVFSTVIWDPSQAHKGMSNTTLWQFVPRHLAGGRSWASVRDSYAAALIERLRGWAPNVTGECILESVAHTPDLLVQKWPNLEAGIFGGRNAGSQVLGTRPFPELSDCSPLPGLYVANASMAPGAGLPGLAGAIAARVAAQDLGARVTLGSQ